MAGTDDIAEKVADLLIDETTKVGTHVIDTAPTIVDGVVRSGVNVVKEVFDKMTDSSVKSKLENMEKLGSKIPMDQFWSIAQRLGYKSDTIRIADADANDFENLLRKERMVFTVLDKKDDNYKVFLFLEKDQEKIEHAKERLKVLRGNVTELAPDKFFSDVEPDKVTVLSNVNDVEAELFRYFAKEEGLLFSHIPSMDDNPGQIVYQTKDIEKARKALVAVGWALSGGDGSRIREQVKDYIKGRKLINLAIDNPDKQIYVISKNNPRNAVAINAKGFFVYKDGNIVDEVNRDDPDFAVRCRAICESLSSPVVLTKEEFLAPETTVESIKKRATMQLFPTDTVTVTDDGNFINQMDGYNTLLEQDRINSIEHLISMKISLDTEGNNMWGRFEESVSFSEFAGYEHYMDNDQQESREHEFERFKKAAFYAKNNMDPHDIDMSDRSIDYLISRAYIRSGTRPQPEHEKTHTTSSHEI